MKNGSEQAMFTSREIFRREIFESIGEKEQSRLQVANNTAAEFNPEPHRHVSTQFLSVEKARGEISYDRRDERTLLFPYSTRAEGHGSVPLSMLEILPGERQSKHQR